MNQLLPIIRRVRRPLLPVESVPDGPLPTAVVGNVEPVQVNAEHEAQSAEQESAALSRNAATEPTEPAEAGTAN
jgi:hypothetical protein